MKDTEVLSGNRSPQNLEPILCTAFEGNRRIASGPLPEVARKVKRLEISAKQEPILVFNDLTGAVVELDLRGTLGEVAVRFSEPGYRAEEVANPQLKKGPGRPKLGVISREVTLLPDQWDWLDAQPGGASAALRRIILAAKRSSREKDCARQSQEAVYRFMTTMAGNLPGFEDALRAFYRRDQGRLGGIISPWPKDIRDHVKKLVAVANRDEAVAVAQRGETTSL